MIMITFIYSAVLGGLAGILVAPILFVSIQMGSTIALKAFAATIIGGFGDVPVRSSADWRSASSKPSVPPIFQCLQGRLCFPGAGAVSGVPASGHLWRTRRGESMSAPSENMPITCPRRARSRC